MITIGMFYDFYHTLACLLLINMNEIILNSTKTNISNNYSFYINVGVKEFTIDGISTELHGFVYGMCRSSCHSYFDMTRLAKFRAIYE